MAWRTVAVLWVLMIAACVPCRGVLIGREDAYELVVRLVDETEAIYDGILSDKPYHPSLFAWGMHYLARTCLLMYRATGERYWLNKALGITDYFVHHSDVNADGIPSWGSYNDTWGIPKWEFKEYTVWDAVNCLPMIETVKLIRSDPGLCEDPGLVAKADAYLELVRQVVVRHYPCWTQVTENQGYYWDDPTEDVGPYVNGFASLGHVELALFELTGNGTYLERPRQMANYMVGKMRYDAADDLYTWDYLIGSAPPEDISHGAIDLEFLIMANRMGIIGDEHILRLCNTYSRRIWNVLNLPEEGFPLAMRVDGSGDEDYTALSRGWIYLADYAPEIFEQQRIALGIHQERYGLYPAGYEVEAAAQIILMEGALRDRGIDPKAFTPVSIEHLRGTLSTCRQRLEETRSMGLNPPGAHQLADEAECVLETYGIGNASVAIAVIWEAWDLAGGYLDAGRALRELETERDAVALLGGNVSAASAEIEDLWRRLRAAGSEAELGPILADMGEAELELMRARAAALIAKADEVVERAKGMGIDTSRHEILLGRAHEEYVEGNYGPAAQFTEYPLRLLDEIPELGLWQCMLLGLLLAAERPRRGALGSCPRAGIHFLAPAAPGP